MITSSSKKTQYGGGKNRGFKRKRPRDTMADSTFYFIIYTHKTLCRFFFFLQTCKVEVTASHKSQNVIVVFIAENNKSQISL